MKADEKEVSVAGEGTNTVDLERKGTIYDLHNICKKPFKTLKAILYLRQNIHENNLNLVGVKVGSHMDDLLGSTKLAMSLSFAF